MNIQRQQTLKQAAASYRDSLRKSLQNRLEAAKAKGDEKLIRQLEAEANYLKIQ